MANFLSNAQEWSTFNGDTDHLNTLLLRQLRDHSRTFSGLFPGTDGGSSGEKRKRDSGDEQGPLQGAGPSQGGNALHDSPGQRSSLPTNRPWDNFGLTSRGYQVREAGPKVGPFLQKHLHT